MGTFLFSIDLEDVSLELEGSSAYTDRVVPMTNRYLSFLQKHNTKATFFTVGETARKFPELIKEIDAEGHEVACHSDLHIPLTQQTPDSFKDDLQRNIEALKQAGVAQVYGFRAPIFSLTEKTQWAYRILRDLGIKYSSSVLPANNPLYGWRGFGIHSRLKDQVLEIPITISISKLFQSPIAGGTYFRLFPWLLIHYTFQKQIATGNPVVGYFHPQDGDDQSQPLKYKDYNFFYNRLLNYNKKSVFKKLEQLLENGYKIITYYDYYLKNS